MNGSGVSNRGQYSDVNSNSPEYIKAKAGDGALHLSNRFLLGTAVSVASLMAATAAAQEGGVALPTIDVTGNQDTGYQATQQTITRLPTPLRDTPQTINIVPQQVIRDQQATSMEQALRNIPGITFSAGEGGQQGDAPFIRGQEARGDIFRDGIRDPGWYTRDLFSIDRVEVYKGPSAFAFGRGSTGGAINNVSKLPTGQTFKEIEVTAYSQDGIRGTFDAGGKYGGIDTRLALLAQDVDTADRDYVFTRRWGVAPSFSFDFNDRTKNTFSYVYQGEESVPDYGRPYLPAPAYNVTSGIVSNNGYYGNGQATGPVPSPRNVFYGFASGALRDMTYTETHVLTNKIEHDIAPAVKLTNATRYVAVDRLSRPTAPRTLQDAGGSTTVTTADNLALASIGRQHFETDTENMMVVNQTDLNAKFMTGSLAHTMVAGVELALEKRDQSRWNLCYPAAGGTTPAGAPVCRTSLFYPDPNASAGFYAVNNAPNNTESHTAAIYLSDTIKINRYWEILLAGRYDHFETEYVASGAPVLRAADDLFSWRVGSVFHPTANSSVYIAHGISFNPSAELGTLSNGNVGTDPEESHTTEIGGKIDVLGGRLSLTASAFHTEKINARVAQDPSLPNNQQIQILDGQVRIDGLEFGIAGQVTDRWQVMAGYSFLDTEIEQSTIVRERGARLPNTPPHTFSLWNTFAVTQAWTVGFGVYYASEDFVNTTNTSFVPEYWKVDAMANYKVNATTSLQLNVYNLTDELYYSQYYGGHAVPAPGRYASVSMKVRW